MAKLRMAHASRLGQFIVTNSLVEVDRQKGNLIIVTFSGQNKENYNSTIDTTIHPSKSVEMKLLNSSENEITIHKLCG